MSLSTKPPAKPTFLVLPLQLAILLIRALQLIVSSVALLLLFAYGGPRIAVWFVSGRSGERPNVRGASHAELLVLLYAVGATALFVAGVEWAGALLAVIAGAGLLLLPIALVTQRSNHQSS